MFFHLCHYLASIGLANTSNSSTATGRRVHFASSTTVKEASRHGGHLLRLNHIVARSTKLERRERQQFPNNKSYHHWLCSCDGTTIAEGELKGRLGYVANYLERDNQCLLVLLASPNPELHLREIALVERKHFESGAAGSLPPTVSGMKHQLHQSESAGDGSQPNPKRRRTDVTYTFTLTQPNQAPTNVTEPKVDADVVDDDSLINDGALDMDVESLPLRPLLPINVNDGALDMDVESLPLRPLRPINVNDGVIDMDVESLPLRPLRPIKINDGAVTSKKRRPTTKRRRTNATDPFTFTQSNQAPTNVTETEDMECDLTPDDHEEDEKEEEEDGNHAPVTTTGTKKRRLSQSEPVSDDGQPANKRPCKDNAGTFIFTQPKQDAATGTGTNTSAAPSHSPSADDDGGSWDQDDDADADAADATDDVADTSRLGSYTITGGKYADQQCIIVKHLARKVRVELVDSGMVTCISRRSLGLDVEKTSWHEEPRRSPRGHEQPRRSARIKAMMEASSSDVV